MVRKCALCKGVGHNRATCQSRSNPPAVASPTPLRNSHHQVLPHARTSGENTAKNTLHLPTQLSSIPTRCDLSRSEASPSARLSALANPFFPTSV